MRGVHLRGAPAANAAIAACSRAVAQLPEQRRLQLQLGRAYYEKQQFDQAIGWFGEAAARGSVRAKTLLGFHYRDGRGIERNLTDVALAALVGSTYLFEKAS